VPDDTLSEIDNAFLPLEENVCHIAQPNQQLQKSAPLAGNVKVTPAPDAQYSVLDNFSAVASGPLVDTRGIEHLKPLHHRTHDGSFACGRTVHFGCRTIQGKDCTAIP
jgi:hypothetical protein